MIITIPVPGSGNNPNSNGGTSMPSAHAERYDDLTLQIGMQAQRSADLYADDARRAYQRRVDEISIQEALSQQIATTDRVASGAMQLQSAVGVPRVNP